MSDIQSISQNNYILHNIDAKKLYVQEPLFTANSGDAVYVGWRPDETVLWSGTPATSVNLSESFSNFETIKITAYAQEQHSGMAQTFEFPGTNSAFDLHIYDYNTSGSSVINYLTKYKVNGTNFSASIINHWWQSVNAVTGGTWAGRGSSPIVPMKIVGCNRKENV